MHTKKKKKEKTVQPLQDRVLLIKEDLLLKNLLKTNLNLLKNMDITTCVLF